MKATIKMGFAAALVYATAILATPKIAYAAECGYEWTNYVQSAETADYYCSLEPSQHTDELCRTAIENYDFYRSAYERCVARDGEGPIG